MTSEKKPAAKYAKWIRKNYPTRISALAVCQGATAKMVEAFPELKRVPGHVYTVHFGRRAHWWCETPDGSVVDPTAAQFEDAFMLEYHPFEPGQEVRVGRCMNCGDDIDAVVQELGKQPEGLYSTTFCDKECAKEMAESMG